MYRSVDAISHVYPIGDIMVWQDGIHCKNVFSTQYMNWIVCESWASGWEVVWWSRIASHAQPSWEFFHENRIIWFVWLEHCCCCCCVDWAPLGWPTSSDQFASPGIKGKDKHMDVDMLRRRDMTEHPSIAGVGPCSKILGIQTNTGEYPWRRHWSSFGF
jgi:hypothetical protein